MILDWYVIYQSFLLFSAFLALSILKFPQVFSIGGNVMSTENKNVETKTIGKKPGVGRKILNVIFNIFWALFGGIGMAIECLFSGIGTCIMIIPIFFGIPGVYFRVMGLAFAPAGKKVEINFGSHPVKNVFYWIFGGLFVALGSYLWGAVLCCTVIGIPLGLQQFKFAKYWLAPFGAKVYKNGQEVTLDKKELAAKQAKEAEEARLQAAAQIAAANSKPKHTVDDLPKLKALLDQGVITQEEFDKTKKEILGL